MTDQNESALIITQAINDLKKAGMADAQIAIDLLGVSVGALVEAIGGKPASKFLHEFASEIEQGNYQPVIH